MRIRNRGTVFFGEQEGELASSCFHGVCAFPSGRWLVTFRAAPRKQDAFPQRVLLTYSDDEGGRWSSPAECFPPVSIVGKPGVWRGAMPTSLGGSRAAMVLYWVDSSDPSLPFFNEETEGLLDSRLFLSLSEDAGEHWSPPQRIDTSPFNTPTPFTGPLLPLRNGQWALQFETNKTYYDTSTWKHASVLMFSADEGRTWPEFTAVAADPEGRVFYWDQRPAALADGSLMDMFWTFDRQDAVYLNIHGRESCDDGRTWSELWDTGLPGQPGPPALLPDGRLAMPYVDRSDVPLIKIRSSRDRGRTWPAETELIVDDSASRAQETRKATMQDAWTEMSAFSVGLPTTVVLPSGDLLVVYYGGRNADHTGIHWARIGTQE